MTTATKNAPSLSGNSAEGDDQNPRKEPIMNEATSVPPTSDTARYIVVGTNVYDREADRIARFQHAGTAEIGADWLNSPDATPEDYEWTEAPSARDLADEGPTIGDLFRCADILRVDPSDLIGALVPLLRELRERQKARTLRRAPDVDDRQRALEDM